MSRAGGLLYRLDRLGYPDMSEQDPDAQLSDDNAAMTQQDDDDDEENIDPEMSDPDSPFSRITHNTDGSMKTDQDDQQINDRRRFSYQRRK